MRTVLACCVAVALLAGPASSVGAQVDISDLGDGYADEIREAQEETDAATAAFAEAETRRYELEGEIARVEARTAETEAELAELRERLRAAAVDEYVRAGIGPPSIFDEDLNRQARANALAEIVTASDTDALDAYRAVAEDLERDQQELDALLAEQRELVEQLESARDVMNAELGRLQQLEAERQAEIARREEAERQRQAELAREREAQAARDREAAAARQRQQAPTPSAPRRSTPSTPIASGSFVCPVQGPNSFVDSWGAPRSGGRAHKGVDMMAAHGTPVVAPVAGTVTHRGNSLGGLSFHLDGVDGHYYYGTHLSSYGNSGQVEAGTIVGYVGDSGNARGNPHLHFEIHPNGGGAVNPYPTVRAACG